MPYYTKIEKYKYKAKDNKTSYMHYFRGIKLKSHNFGFRRN